MVSCLSFRRLPGLSVALAVSFIVSLGLTRSASADYRADLEIRLGGRFVNHAAAVPVWPPGLIVNYYTGTPDAENPGGVQVVIYGEEPHTEQIFRSTLVTRAQQFDTEVRRDIDGAECWRYSSANSPTYASWHCLYRGYYLLVAKQDGKTKVDEVSIIRTLMARLAQGGVSPREAAFRKVLLSGLGLSSPVAKGCLDTVMNEAEAQAPKDRRMADDIAALREAAARVHAIDVLAEVPVGPGYFDEFDPKWWDALREVVPDPNAPPDPGETALDRLIDLLPPPLGTLVNLTRTGSKVMRSVKSHVVDPEMHRKIYACYRAQREADQASRLQPRMGQDALENGAAQTLLDATAGMAGVRCPGAETFKSSYERELGSLKGAEREREYARLLRPVAVRFEFIYQVENARANKAQLVADAWKPASGVLERLKSRVNACIAAAR
jgi:hypothetical protein